MTILLFLLATSQNALAFPEFARHGYLNCTSCHASQTGGGLLTEYGRAIAKELLSSGRFFFEKRMDLTLPEGSEEQFLHGSTNPPKGLNLGGDIRALQMISDNARATVGRFVLMQADLEGMWSDGNRFQVLASVGRTETPKADNGFEYFLSRRHWVNVLMGPPEAMDRYQLRVGRFFPAYGLNIAEHTVVTRRQLGFNEQQESYNTELSYLSEDWNVFATAILGRPDHEGKSHEEGASLQLSRNLGTHYKVGWNGFYGKDPARGARAERYMTGFFGMLGFTPQIYSLVDFSMTRDKVLKSGVAGFSKLGWEFTQGVHLFGMQEIGRTSLASATGRTEAYSLGIQYFPRVHWDFLVTARQEKTIGPGFDSVFWFVAHYYL